MRLILIRHGQTSSNVNHALDTAAPGADLTDVGRAQAEALVGALDGTPIDRLAVSTRVRTSQTAAPLAAARGLTPLVLEELREIAAGDFEMSSDHDDIHSYLEVTFRWTEGEPGLRMPGAFTGHEELERFDAGIARARDGVDGTLAVVAHGAIIRTWTATRGVNVPEGFARDHLLLNTGIVEFEEQDGRWILQRWMGTPFER